MPAIGVALAALVLLMAMLSTVWAWQLRTEDAGIVDPVQAFSLGTVTLLYAGLGTDSLPIRLLVGADDAVWGVRLGWHSWQRNAGKSGDACYRKLCQEWGATVP